MNISAPFIRRPVATTLLTAGIVLVGIIAFNVLPVSPLPQVDFPTISVSASLPGGSPEIIASSIATPLERQFSQIAGVTEMTSSSSLGSASVTLQFDLSRDIDGAARDVEAAINAARTYLPANLPGNPTYRKVNPADSPIIILGLTSDKYDKPTLYDEASSVVAQKLSQISGVGQVTVGGGAGPSVRVEVNPTPVSYTHLHPQHCRARFAGGNFRRHVHARLQSRQSFADGADHCHGIRGGRCDCRNRKHYAPSRKWHETDGGCPEGRGGDWVHGSVDEHLAHCRLHSHPDDERRGGAPVP